MSVALITRGMIAGFSAAGGSGAPYPVPIEDIEVITYDVKDPFIDIDADDIPPVPIGYDAVEEYLPTKTSTIETLPTAGLRTFPTPRNL